MNKPQSNITPISTLQTNIPKSLGVPESEQTEEALVAALLYKPALIPEVAALLDNDAWFYLRHTLIWNAMIEMVNDNVAVNVVTLTDYMLRTDGTGTSALHDIGGPALFTRLASEYVSGTSDYKEYVNIINAAYRRRCMLVASDDLHRAAMDYEVAIDKSVNSAYEVLDKLSDKTRTFTTIGDGLHEHMDIAEARRVNPIAMGIPSGISGLDSMIDGFHKRRVYVVAARTHHGKTALLSTIAHNAAGEGIRVGFFNVADGNKQDVVSRIIGIAANVNAHEVLMGRCNQEQYSRYVKASRITRQYPIYIESDKGMGLPELLVKARNMKYRYGLDMICIDYVQRIGVDTRNPKAPQTRPEQLAYISKTITKLAGDSYLDIPILLAAQLNRGADRQRPGIADIKGSGAIEEDADVIIMPYREDFGIENMEVIVGKNKVTGRTGTINAMINKSSTKISMPIWE